MWPGFSCTVKCLTDGFFLNVDTSTKFIQQRTVLDYLKELRSQGYSNNDIEKTICPKFDDTMYELTSQSEIDARRLVVITSYNSASY